LSFTTATIGDIASVQTGPFGSQLHNKDYVSVGTPIVTVEHLGQRKMTRQNLPCVSDSDKDRLSKYTLEYGDLVFSRVGSVDRCSWVSEEEDGWMFSGRCLRVRSNNPAEVYHKYLYYFFNLESTKDFVRNVAVGATMPSINTRLLSEVPISFPGVEAQRQIGDILSALDDRIEENTKINHHLEQIAQAIFKSWFVDFEPWGCVMPDDWRETELGEVATLSAGGDKPAVSSPTLTDECQVPIFSNGIDNFGLYGYTDRPKITDECVTVSARGTIGYVCLRQDPFVPIVRLVTVIPNNKFITAKYLYLYLSSIHITGVGTTQQQLTVPDFKKYRILVPNRNAVESFTQTVDPMFEAIRHKRAENECLATSRNALLPRLMSGELSVADLGDAK
jgi:type I restriction enzyme S subunit